MSEWGNPVYWRYITPQGEQTRRTETSKYPEEEKTTVIAQVVASERARAQTETVKAVSGLEDHNIDYTINLNCVGKQAIEGESPVRVK